MNNYIQHGDTVEVTAPGGGVTTGLGVKIGALFGVATATVAAAAKFNLQITGVVDIVKTSAQAWAEGDRIYWDDGNSRADTDSKLGILIGVAVAVAANPTATGRVRLNAAVAEMFEGQQAAIVSLTDSSGGSADDTIADVEASYTEATLANNFADLAAKTQEILVALRAAGIIAP